ncbi:hypothetical protein TPHA_0A03560 [Tetrapisispora phaffii CBS 4417]|uniref:Chitobiosyldiphosphodolichol beta-mannosyltransferase n=1 Tax=Tetrapisispora phaffii (strain ATCC 24235 / CBS 4417 / NBRC 1672 / NRRL Y-8282 / UCD 70-5) TaxID=1071381 RepID=G8BNF4_TETPH|nr:hypothetical protein TPHA_0A03560 [Tetrapisispora phaffii CBS 4417]CCE61432.1 hypothetical protein TPHA_0A03560 [Tetrapisispora phaffii CBS 4417]
MLGLYDVSHWLIVMAIIYLVLPLLTYLLLPYIFYGTKSTKKRIIIYVIGEIGHSPRMCYHALSFSEHGYDVELCGYVTDSIPKDIIDDENITIHEIPIYENTRNTKSLLFLLKKVLFQIFTIVKQLWYLRGSNYLLVQNPPTIPILPLAVIYRLTGCKLIIDWHNLGYSILQLKFNQNFYHPLVLCAYMIEYIFSRFANYNITVTEAMKTYLVERFGLNPAKCFVLYDRPPHKFQPFNGTIEERLSIIKKEDFIKDFIPSDFDIIKGDKILVTSTSFTPDEDIKILVGALKIYEHTYQKFDNNLPKIICFITGKGPMKEEIMKQVANHDWKLCKIEFLWLSAEDYPKLLRLCDYGVSLHASSSGLDLPMKILDMNGSGLPVIALNYPVLNELVVHKKNGLKFTDRRELHESLIFAMKDPELLDSLKRNVILEAGKRWNSSWEPAMKEMKLI